jgi:ketosteroid isomerase-like protein
LKNNVFLLDLVSFALLLTKNQLKMKYLTLLLAVVFFSCSTDSSQTAKSTESDDNAASEAAVEETATGEEADETATIVTETVVLKEIDINEDATVKATFLKIIDAVNSATGENAELALSFLDKDYVFKGRDRDANVERLEKQFTSYKSQISDVDIRQLNSSCNLAYLIASFKRTMKDRATGEVKVDARDKVGLFIFRKDSAGEWKLLVQKTDDGFAHWFYMPGE